MFSLVFGPSCERRNSPALYTPLSLGDKQVCHEDQIRRVRMKRGQSKTEIRKNPSLSLRQKSGCMAGITNQKLRQKNSRTKFFFSLERVGRSAAILPSPTPWFFGRRRGPRTTRPPYPQLFRFPLSWNVQTSEPLDDPNTAPRRSGQPARGFRALRDLPRKKAQGPQLGTASLSRISRQYSVSDHPDIGLQFSGQGAVSGERRVCDLERGNVTRMGGG